MNFAPFALEESGASRGKGSKPMSVERRKTASGVRWRFTKMIRGRRIRSPYIYLTKDQAAQAESNYLSRFFQTGKAEPISPENLETFSTLLKRRVQWLKDHRSTKHTEDNKSLFSLFLSYAPDWAEKFPADITSEMIQEVADKWAADLLARGKSRLSVNKTLVALQSTWNRPWGTRRGRQTGYNPFAIIERFPTEKKTKRIPTEKQIQKVIKACSNAEQKLFVRLMKDTGARPGELLRLEWDDVEPGMITLKTAKKKGGILTPRKVKVRMSFGGIERIGRRVFPHTRFWAVQFLKKACEEAEIPFFGVHTIRHFHASKLIKEGWTIPQIQARLGHESPLTTAKYIHELLGV